MGGRSKLLSINKMGVEKDIIEEGDGKTFPVKGDKLKMHYTGTLAENGEKFDSSRDRGSLFEVAIGTGQVIKGWDEGVPMMSLGERAVLHLSSDYAYGDRGSPPKIPGGAALDFDVRLVAINDKQFFYSEEHKANFEKKMAEWKEKQLKKYDSKEEFKAKKDEKFGGRAEFEAHLDSEISADVAALNIKPKS